MREEGLAREKAISKQMVHPIRMQHVRNTEYDGMQDLSWLQSPDLRPVPHILVRLYKPVTTPITVMYYVCLHSECNSRKQRSENTLNLFTAWLLLGTLKSTVWHFVYRSVNTAVLYKREDRFSGILEWKFFVIKNITLFNLRYLLKMAPYDGLVVVSRARFRHPTLFATEVYCSPNYW